MHPFLELALLLSTLQGGLTQEKGALDGDVPAIYSLVDEKISRGGNGILNVSHQEELRNDHNEEESRSSKGNFGDPIILLRGRWPMECNEHVSIKCNRKMKYRTFDGRCNNLLNPTWGAAGTCSDRLMPPDYGDGKSAPRLGKKGRRLPNARTVSLYVHSNLPQQEKRASHMLMAFGQFLSLDITVTEIADDRKKSLNCCSPAEAKNQLCSPVSLSKEDPFYSKYNQKCHNFVRSDACNFCEKGSRQQANSQSVFIDGSMLYGSVPKRALSLRGDDGELTTFKDPTSGELLPRSDDPYNDGCSYPDKGLLCFKSGTDHVNQNPALTALHTVFLRHHNRIASELREINPMWSGDKIYFETRKIVGAQLQMITYNEYLPLILGKDRSKFFKIPVMMKGYTKYESKTNPTVLNPFATAAFRFGHAQVHSFFSEYPETDNVAGRFLRDLYFYPFGLYHGELELFIRGLLLDLSLEVSQHLVPDLTNYLYRRKGNMTGEDLALRDIMRGRDHGLQSYIKYVSFCNGPTITEFRDLDGVMDQEVRGELQQLYKSVQDIDLFTGGMAETHYPGAMLGPTFSCILGLQFYHLKFGDRFYFEHGGQTGSFTPGQLTTLRKTLLSKIICETTTVDNLQRYALLLPSKANPIVNCKDIPDIDINQWRVRPQKKEEVTKSTKERIFIRKRPVQDFQRLEL